MSSQMNIIYVTAKILSEPVEITINTKFSYVVKQTTPLNNKKNGTFANISTKRLKAISDICILPLNNI